MQNALGKVDSVLLLGGRSEIGLAITKRLVRDGARRVVLAAREADSADGAGDGVETTTAVKSAGAESVGFVAFDAARPDTHEEFVRKAFEELGGDADVVVDAFGVLGSQEAYESDPLAAAESVTPNFTGHVSVGLHVARQLREQGHGTLVVLSSVAGVRVRKSNFVYGSTKAGLDGFAQGLGDAMRGSGARVMVVRPGFVRTKMTTGMDGPLPVTAEAVADAVANGLRLRRETVWVPAKLQAVFGVMRMVPRPIWRRLPF